MLDENLTDLAAAASRYATASKLDKGKILDELCRATGWHRSHARRRLVRMGTHGVPSSARPRRPVYDSDTVDALYFCWVVLGRPTGKRLVAVLPELVPALRRHGELTVSDAVASALTAMSPATIDRRLAPHRGSTAPGLDALGVPGAGRARVPIVPSTWWGHGPLGRVELDVVVHHGWRPEDPPCSTITIVDGATGWTERRSVANMNRATAALTTLAHGFPFTITGVHSVAVGDGLNEELAAWCSDRRIEFVRSCLGTGNDGTPGERRSRAQIHAITGYHWHGPDSVFPLNRMWERHDPLSNFFCPQQRVIRGARSGDRVRRRYDTATTPYRRVLRHDRVSLEDKNILADRYETLNPARLHREIRELKADLNLRPRARLACAHASRAS